MNSRFELSSKTILDIKDNNKLVIGIDLGTTFSCVCAYRSNKLEIVTNDVGKRVTPSMVSFRSGEILIGDAARNIMNQNAENTIKDSKRLIGRKFNEKVVQEDMSKWLFTVEENPENGKPQYVINVDDEETRYYPEEISSMILKKLRGFSEDFLANEIKKAVITVPAYFNNSQREATKKAGEIAGFEEIRILNEPTAAALAYGFQNKIENEKIVLVFDLGGGTFDVSIVKINNKVYEVLAINGDSHLGGEDFNNRLVDYIVKEFLDNNGIDLTINSKAMRRVIKCVEDAKIDLSTLNEVNIDIDSICEGEDLQMLISRPTYEDLCQDLWNKCITIMEKTIQEANLTKEKIDDIVLAGGSSRTPKIQEMVTQFFNGKKPYKSVNPDEAIAYGATIFGISELYQDQGYNSQIKIKNDMYNNIKVSNRLQKQNNNNIPLSNNKIEDNKIPQINNNSDDDDIKKPEENKNELVEASDSENSQISNNSNKEDKKVENKKVEKKKFDNDNDNDELESIERANEKEIKINENDDYKDNIINNDEIDSLERYNKKENEDKNEQNNYLVEDSDNSWDDLDEFRNLVVKDATPLSIGIGVAGGTMIKIIPKLSKLPNRNEKKIFKRTFTTFKDYQESYTVRIYEGENELIKNNFLLGEFTVSGFEPKKRGEIVIEILFYLDHDSILTVKARQNDEIQKELVIKNRDQYSKEELEKMKKHTKDFELQEKNKKQILEIRKTMESMIFKLKNNNDNEIKNKAIEIEKWMNYNPKASLENYNAKYLELVNINKKNKF